MKTITFYSYKGGVGRSLALSNVASRLSDLGKKVCVLDFDLEAPGLHFKFHKYSKQRNIEYGIVDYIDDRLNGKKEKFTLKDYSIILKPNKISSADIFMIPAGDIANDSYWQKLSRIDWTDLFFKDNSIGVNFFLDLKQRILQELNPDFLLIDSRTGVTEMAGVTLRLLADEVVILAANNLENKEGSLRIMHKILNPETTLLGNIPKINFVLTRLPFGQDEFFKEKKVANSLKATFIKEFPKTPISFSIIHSDRRLEEEDQLLIGYEIKENSISIESDYLKLFDIVCADDLDDKTTNTFYSKKKAEELYLKAKTLEENEIKLKLLNEAIELDNEVFEYYFSRAFLKSKNLNYEDAINDYKKALKLKTNNSYLATAYNNLGHIYFWHLEETDVAKQYFEKALELDKLHEKANRNLANVYEKKGQLNESINIVNKIIDSIDFEDPLLYNSRAHLYRQQGKYKEAKEDIFKAIELDSTNPILFGTLAEIYFGLGMMNEFYLNLNIGLSMTLEDKNNQLNAKALNSAKDVYEKVKEEPRFIELLERYNIDIEEVLA